MRLNAAISRLLNHWSSPTIKASCGWRTTTLPNGSRPPACSRWRSGDPSYRTVKGILSAGTDKDSTPTRPAGDGGAAAHLRGPAGLSLLPDPDPEPGAQADVVEVAS